MKEENGPFIALIIFVILSLVFGVLAWLNLQELEGDEKIKPKAKEIEELKAEITKLSSTREDFKATAQAKLAEIRVQEALYNQYNVAYEYYGIEHSRRNNLLKWFNDYEAQATNLQGMITTEKSKTQTRINKEITEARERMERDIQEKTQKKDDAIARVRVDTEGLTKSKKQHMDQMNFESSASDDSKNVLSYLTQREVERATVLDEEDGTILLADVVHHLVVINLGTADGIKNGYRFEVFTRRDNKKVHKAFIEVRHADVSKSECMVVRRPVTLPKDPLSDYFAEGPEAIYSPYQESGQKSTSAQVLSGHAKTVMSGAPKLDPIIEGDLIQNPFYSPRKKYTFYIAGAKEILNDRQKSAIRYRWPEIKATIEAHGGKVATTAEVGVDYIIAQKNPKTEGTDAEKAEFQKAVELGIPVIYEWELFRFLDKR